jgi:hypothetical protein
VAPLLLVTIALSALAAFKVWDQTYLQWSERHWVTTFHAHNPMVIVAALAILVHFALVPVVGIWWISGARTRGFPHRLFATWLLVLVVGAATHFPSSLFYAATAIYALGPPEPTTPFLRKAANYDSVLLLDALIRRGARIEPWLLAYAAGSDSPRVAAHLIREGFPVNDLQFESRITALHNAVDRKQYRMAELLMEAGARTDVMDGRGRTPLDLAQNDERMLEILRARGR